MCMGDGSQIQEKLPGRVSSVRCRLMWIVGADVRKFFGFVLGCNRFLNVDVSKNRYTPKWTVYNGKPY